MQYSVVETHSSARALRVPRRDAHQSPPSTPKATANATPPASSSRSTQMPSSHSRLIEGQPANMHAPPKSKCSSARSTSEKRSATVAWPGYCSGRSARMVPYAKNAVRMSVPAAKNTRRRRKANTAGHLDAHASPGGPLRRTRRSDGHIGETTPFAWLQVARPGLEPGTPRFSVAAGTYVFRTKKPCKSRRVHDLVPRPRFPQFPDVSGAFGTREGLGVPNSGGLEQEEERRAHEQRERVEGVTSDPAPSGPLVDQVVLAEEPLEVPLLASDHSVPDHQHRRREHQERPRRLRSKRD